MDNIQMPVQMPWTGANTPHGTIEVNQACNISCHACYKDKFNLDKPLSVIKDEIDLLISLRKVCSITIAGGEPTLYPQLPEVIRYISGKGVRPLLLTNGTQLTPEKLMEYQESGLVRIFLHIDSRQKGRPDRDVFNAPEDEINALREHYIRTGTEAGIEMAPTVTLYQDRLEGFSDVIEFCRRFPGVNTMLITNYTQNLNHGAMTDDGLSVSNRMVYDTLYKRLGVKPVWYIPSTRNQQELRWMFYVTALTENANGITGQFHFNPRYPGGLRLLPEIARMKYGHYAFDNAFSRFDTVFLLGLYGLMSWSPKELIRSLFFAFKCLFSPRVRVFRVCFQQGPNQLPDGSYEACLDCPDATIRNGKLLNLCLVDKLEAFRK